MMRFWNIFYQVGLALVCLKVIVVVLLCVRAALFPILQENPCFDDHGKTGSGDYDVLELDINETLAVERFRNGLKYETVCRKAGDYNRKELLSLISYIKRSYPAIHLSPLVKLEVIGNYSLLYKVEGQHVSLPPYLLLAHLDVVPTDNQDWKHPPFSANLEDGFIYARGTLDDKHNLFAILEALELLLQSGYKPKRTFYISFGHDEECLGLDGAVEVAKVLRERKIHFEFVLDEGTMVVNDLFTSIVQPVALVAVSEKGQLTIQLSVNHTGGHSSMPEKESGIGILSRAILKLHTEAHSSMLGRGIEKFLLEAVSYHTNWLLTIIFRNIWFFEPLLSWVMSAKPSTSALIRTTTAVTMLNSGVKNNVIPTYVEAIVNHRIHSSQTVNEIFEADRKLINDDRVEMKILQSFEPVRPSCFLASCPGYQVIKETLRTLWKDAVVVPGDLFGNTDSRHYTTLADDVYRFSPILLAQGELKTIHGIDERISAESFVTMIKFYRRFVLNADKYHVHGDGDTRHQEL